MRKMSVRKLTALGMLTALTIIMAEVAKFPIVPKVLELSFGFVPVAVAGMLFGPWTAMVMSGVADILGAILAGVEFFPGYTLSAVLSGLFYGLLLKNTCQPGFGALGKGFLPNKALLKVMLAQLLVSLIVYSGCNTLWAYLMGYGRSTEYIITRLTVNVVAYPVYVCVLALIMRYRRTLEKAVK